MDILDEADHPDYGRLAIASSRGSGSGSGSGSCDDDSAFQSTETLPAGAATYDSGRPRTYKVRDLLVRVRGTGRTRHTGLDCCAALKRELQPDGIDCFPSYPWSRHCFALESGGCTHCLGLVSMPGTVDCAASRRCAAVQSTLSVTPWTP